MKKETAHSSNHVRMLAGAASLVMALGCTAAPSSPPDGPLLGQQPPTNGPAIFAPNFLSTDLCERDFTMSPDGTEAYFTIQGGASFRDWFSVIATTQRGPSGWSTPAVAVFSGRYSDLEPFVAPDGQRLYFVSNRPRQGDGQARGDFDVWYVDRVGEGWSEANNLGAPVNSDKDEFYPSVTQDGTLYLTAAYEGSENIWRARPEDDGFSTPENLGTAINGERGAYNAFIAPDESYLIFGRGRDLHVSFRREGGEWTDAVNLGEAINWSGLDYCPSVSPDGRYLFFTSTRPPLEPYARDVPPGFDALLAQVPDSTHRKMLGTRLFPYEDLYWVGSAVLDTLRPAAGER